MFHLQGLKQWWVAEQLNVNRLTVMRWLNGKVNRIQHENLEKLAALLDCSINDLVIEDNFSAQKPFELTSHIDYFLSREFFRTMYETTRLDEYDSLLTNFYRDEISNTKKEKIADNLVRSAFFKRDLNQLRQRTHKFLSAYPAHHPQFEQAKV